MSFEQATGSASKLALDARRFARNGEITFIAFRLADVAKHALMRAIASATWEPA
jgi:hypothetical protein